MKIVITDTTIDGPMIGGAQTFLPLLMHGLYKEGHEVHLVTKGTPDKKIRKQVEESRAILHTSLWRKKGLPQDAAIVFAKWVNELKPDIFLISVSADVAWLALPYLNPSIATFTIGHTDDETFYLPARHYQQFITTAIGVSDEVCNHYHTKCNFPLSAIDWIPYGVKAKASAPGKHNDQPIRLIYVGRVVEEQKRISDLIKIVQELSARKISFHLKIVGDGTEMPLLKESLQDEIKKGTVELLGWLKTDEVIHHLLQSDLFLLTSAYEGFCIALLEAMANGCCPIVTDIKSGNKQLIKNGENGFVFPIGDTSLFVKKIAELSQHSDMLFLLRIKAWETGRNYSIERMVAAYSDCFEKAMQETSAHPRETNINFPVMETCRSVWPLWLRRIKTAIQ